MSIKESLHTYFSEMTLNPEVTPRDEFIEHMSNFLGYQYGRRPYSDKKIPLMRFVPIESSLIKNVRYARIKHLYNKAIVDIARHRCLRMPNGWEYADMFSALDELRSEYKNTPKRHLANAFANLMFIVVYRSAEISYSDIVTRGRNITLDAIREVMDSGAVVVYATLDEIYYVGDQVSLQNAHYDIFNGIVVLSTGVIALQDLSSCRGVPEYRICAEPEMTDRAVTLVERHRGMTKDKAEKFIVVEKSKHF